MIYEIKKDVLGEYNRLRDILSYLEMRKMNKMMLDSLIRLDRIKRA